MKTKIIVLMAVVSFGANASAVSDVLKSKAENDLSSALHQLKEDFPKGVVSNKDIKDFEKTGRALYGKGVEIGKENKVSCMKAASDFVKGVPVDNNIIDSYKGSDEEKALLRSDLDAVFSALGGYISAGCMSTRM